MINEDYRRKLYQIIDNARLAPSVHNSQPWEVTLKSKKITIHPSQERALSDGDMASRQTWVSIGIFVEYCVIVARAFGFEPTIKIYPEHATIDLEESTPSDMDLFEQFNKRHTNRAVYQKLSTAKLDQIIDDTKVNGAEAVISRSHTTIAMTARFTGTAIKVALSNTDFRKELAKHIVPPFSPAKIGILTHDLCINPFERLIAKFIVGRGLTATRDSKAEIERWMSASAVIFIVSSGDTQPHWIDAGRSYARTVLHLTKLGYAHCTSAGVAEAFDFHEDLEKELGTKKRIMSAIRVGKSNFKPNQLRRLDSQQIIRL